MKSNSSDLHTQQIKRLCILIDWSSNSFIIIIIVICERENPLCTHPKYVAKVTNGSALQKDQISMSIACRDLLNSILRHINQILENHLSVPSKMCLENTKELLKCLNNPLSYKQGIQPHKFIIFKYYFISMFMFFLYVSIIKISMILFYSFMLIYF
jgi:hypothetical protein